MPPYSLLTLRASWLVPVQILPHVIKVDVNEDRCKRDVTIEYLTCAAFEKHLTALHVVRIIIFLGGMCLVC